MTNSATTSELMTPNEVAMAFRCNPKTVSRWAKSGKLPSIRTLGGHRRFRRSDVEAAMDAATRLGADLETPQDTSS